MNRRPDHDPDYRAPVLPFLRDQQPAIRWGEYVLRWTDENGQIHRSRRKLFPEERK